MSDLSFGFATERGPDSRFLPIASLFGKIELLHHLEANIKGSSESEFASPIWRFLMVEPNPSGEPIRRSEACGANGQSR